MCERTSTKAVMLQPFVLMKVTISMKFVRIKCANTFAEMKLFVDFLVSTLTIAIPQSDN